MIKRLAKIMGSGTVMLYAYNEEGEQFIGLVQHLESIEALGKSWFLHLSNGQTLWAEEIEDY